VQHTSSTGSAARLGAPVCVYAHRPALLTASEFALSAGCSWKSKHPTTSDLAGGPGAHRAMDQLEQTVAQAGPGTQPSVRRGSPAATPGTCVVCGGAPGDAGKPSEDFRRCRRCHGQNYCSGECRVGGSLHYCSGQSKAVEPPGGAHSCVLKMQYAAFRDLSPPQFEKLRSDTEAAVRCRAVPT